jgi:hypothetical protein
MNPHWYQWQDYILYLQIRVTTPARGNEFKGLVDNKYASYRNYLG